MEPMEALHQVETALRNAISEVFPGATWLQAKGAPKEEELEERRREEAARRDGVRATGSLLEYAYTYHLTNIIDKNWEAFKPIFEDRQRTLAFFTIINDVRNTVAHNRDLVDFERDLLSGVAGQLRNQVALHKGTKNPSNTYYPVIESVVDSFGTSGVFSITYDHESSARLDVGTRIGFAGSAKAARGKKLEWFVTSDKRIENTRSLRDGWQSVSDGEILDYTHVVSESDVGEHFLIHFAVRSDSKFHRINEFEFDFAHDDSRQFMYAVNPPIDG